MSLSSMTGFARSDGDWRDWRWTWEIKSVNGRGLDIRCRLPAGFEALEPDVRKKAGAALRRGNVNCVLQVQRDDAAMQVVFNQAVFDQIIAIAERAGEGFSGAPARLDGLLGLKGVLELCESGQSASEQAARNAAVLASLDQALGALTAMRREEGGRLVTLIEGQLDAMTELVGAARASAGARPEAIRDRLAKQIAALLAPGAGLSEDRLHQEAALLAVKADVREELDRLEAHIAAARALLAGEGPVGRRLDFLAQEFGREANTLCSKSSDSALTRIGLDLKTVIDQMREQVQNLE
jgi:uncharacterized protein (TIGR00255 family)